MADGTTRGPGSPGPNATSSPAAVVTLTSPFDHATGLAGVVLPREHAHLLGPDRTALPPGNGRRLRLLDLDAQDAPAAQMLQTLPCATEGSTPARLIMPCTVIAARSCPQFRKLAAPGRRRLPTGPGGSLRSLGGDHPRAERRLRPGNVATVASLCATLVKLTMPQREHVAGPGSRRFSPHALRRLCPG